MNALKEWYLARKAIFDTPVDTKVTPELFTRLGHAEHRLMADAREQFSESTTKSAPAPRSDPDHDMFYGPSDSDNPHFKGIQET